MAKKLIAHLAAWYEPGPAGGKGTFVTDGGYLLEEQRMYAELEARARGQPLAVEIEIRPVRDRRTLQQNRLMWVLLTKMAKHYGNMTAESCYLNMLDEAGIDTEIWQVPVKALPVIRNERKVVDVQELLSDDVCVVRVGLGSSTFTRAEMAEFIDRIFDRLAEMGVSDAETTQQYRDWRLQRDG